MAAIMELNEQKGQIDALEELKKEIAILELCIDGAVMFFSGTANEEIGVALQEQNARVRELLKRFGLIY